MKKITDVQRDSAPYRGMEKVTVKMVNGDEIEVVAYDEESRAGMYYAVTHRNERGAILNSFRGN